MNFPRRSHAQWAEQLGISEEAVSLYRDCDVIDLHIDSFIWTRLFGYDLHARHGEGLLGARVYSQVDVPRVRDAELSGATWVITTNPFRTARGRARVFSKNLRRLIDTFSAPESEVKIVRNDAEYEAARASGHHAAFVGIQGGNALDENIDALDRLIDDWVVRVTLVHLTSSSIGQTSSPMRFGVDRGLTDFGRQYVESLNHKKVLVDLAHISRQGFFDAVDVHDSSQPLVVTHTGVSGVHAHWRNLDDEQLRAIARTGGTVGVMYQSSFLGEPWWGGRAEAVVRHLAHIVETVGDEHASLGSDWDGAILPPRDLRTVERLPCVVQCMLDRGWSDDRIRKILGGNFRRVVRQLRG